MNFQNYTELDSKLSYTPCYTQYGRMLLVWNTDKNFLKMCGGKFNFEYLYIK
jgi:hypothetical protein